MEQRYSIWESPSSTKDRPRIQGYLHAGNYRVAWGNPVATKEDLISVAEEFVQYCQKKHKRVVFMCISAHLEKGLAEGKTGGIHWNSINCIRCAYRSVIIKPVRTRSADGHVAALCREDVLHPSHVELSRKDVRKNRLSAWRSGVRIDEMVIKGPTFLPAPALKEEIEVGLERWLAARKGTQIASSALLPWIDSRNRRYFVAKKGADRKSVV